MNQVEVWWFSTKSNKREMVYGKDLSAEQANSLAYRIIHHHNWNELRSLIESHEGHPFSYIITNCKSYPTKITIDLLLSGS